MDQIEGFWNEEYHFPSYIWNVNLLSHFLYSTLYAINYNSPRVFFFFSYKKLWFKIETNQTRSNTWYIIISGA